MVINIVDQEPVDLENGYLVNPNIVWWNSFHGPGTLDETGIMITDA